MKNVQISRKKYEKYINNDNKDFIIHKDILNIFVSRSMKTYKKVRN